MAEDLGRAVLTLDANPLPLQGKMAAAEATAASRLKNMGTRLQATGTKLATTGRTLTRGLTVPILAAGGAIVKVGMDFETEMSKIVGLVGLSREEVDKMSEAVLELAPKVAKSPKELAEALFFVTSAGFEGADAMAILEQSAKASAGGLGETKVVADAVTSAVNAYGIENLSASESTDILTAAVREGKLEADALAPAIGRPIPLAAALGVEFNEVAAAMAAMSRTGTDASTAATQVRAILATLVKPTVQSKDALEAMGLSAEGVRKKVKDDGLLATLQMLEKRTKGDKEAMAELFPNVRALTGVLDLLGGNAEGNVQIFKELEDATGATEDAFKEAQETTEFKFKAALAGLQAEMIRASEVIMPAVTIAVVGLLGAIKGLIAIFSVLPQPLQVVVIAFVAMAAAMGPVMWLTGNLMKLLGGLAKAIAFLTTAQKRHILVAKIQQLTMAASIVIGRAWTASMLAARIAVTLLWAAILGPIGLVVLAIIGLGVVIFVLAKKFKVVRDVIAKVWDAIKKAVTVAAKAMLVAVKASWNAIKAATKVVWNAIKDVVRTVLQIIKTVITTIFRAYVTIIDNTYGRLFRLTRDVWNKIKGTIFAAVRAARDIAVGAFNKIKDVASNMFGKVMSIVRRVKDVFKDAFNAIKGFIQAVVNKIRDLVGPLDKLANIAKDVGGFFGGIGKKIGELAGGPPRGELGAGRAAHVDRFTPLAASFGLSMTSGFRPGDPGYHGLNRARDYSNSFGPSPQMLAFARMMAGRFGSILKELIYTPLGFSIKNGIAVPPFATSTHLNHVHVALRRGGIAPGGLALVGESGPELAMLPRGTRVQNASDTRSILRPDIRVFIGERELTDMVRVVVREKERAGFGAYRSGVVR